MKQTLAAWLLLLVAGAFAGCGDDASTDATSTDDDGTDECGGCALPRCDDPGPCDCSCAEGQVMCIDGTDHVCSSQACFASENVPCGEGSTASSSASSAATTSSSSTSGGAASD